MPERHLDQPVLDQPVLGRPSRPGRGPAPAARIRYASAAARSSARRPGRRSATGRTASALASSSACDRLRCRRRCSGRRCSARSASLRPPIFEKAVDEQPEPALGRQPPGRGMRREQQPGFLEIGHDVADRVAGDRSSRPAATGCATRPARRSRHRRRRSSGKFRRLRSLSSVIMARRWMGGDMLVMNASRAQEMQDSAQSMRGPTGSARCGGAPR